MYIVHRVRGVHGEATDLRRKSDMRTKRVLCGFCWQVVATGLGNRKVRATKMNADSSRHIPAGAFARPS